MSDAAGTTLTFQQVTDIINQAKANGANPMLIGMQIFNTLGDDVTATGDTLRLALTASAIPITGPLVSVVDAIQSLTKATDHVVVALNGPIEIALAKTQIRIDTEVSFDVSASGASTALSNIAGVATHVLFAWPNITSIQLNQNQGHLTVGVTVGDFKKSFPIQ